MATARPPIPPPMIATSRGVQSGLESVRAGAILVYGVTLKVGDSENVSEISIKNTRSNNMNDTFTIVDHDNR